MSRAELIAFLLSAATVFVGLLAFYLILAQPEDDGVAAAYEAGREIGRQEAKTEALREAMKKLQSTVEWCEDHGFVHRRSL